MKSTEALVGTGVMILVLCSHVFACTRLPDEKLFVRDHFDVIVQDRGQPVVGMEVDVELFDKSSDKWNQVATAITDRVGLASFTGVPKGSYFVGTHTPVKNDGHEIEVTNDPHKLIAQRISLTWPPKKVIVTTKFEGILTSFRDRRAIRIPPRCKTCCPGSSFRSRYWYYLDRRRGQIYVGWCASRSVLP